MNTDNRCGRCGVGTMKSWPELSDDEREVVKRLPEAANAKAAERVAMHEWCTRCWNEEITKPRQT